jgi:hypothetical protein
VTISSARPGWPAEIYPALSVELLRHFRLTRDGHGVALGHVAERLVAYIAIEDQSRTRDEIAGTL